MEIGKGREKGLYMRKLNRSARKLATDPYAYCSPLVAANCGVQLGSTVSHSIPLDAHIQC